MNYIELKDINLKFNNQVIFESANLEISSPGFYFLVGRNGCGKTTLFNVLTKRVELDSGNISIKNKEDISYCDANSILFNNLTVRENLLLVTDNLENILKLLKKFNVEKLIDAKPKSLSEGERQRIAIIRTILEDKPIILLDEVTSHIDDETSYIILNYLKELSKNHIIIYATHYKKEVSEFVDYVIHIQNKKIELNNKNVIDNNIEEHVRLNYIPLKLLNKIIRFIPDYIFAIVFISLICVTLLVVWLFQMTPNKAILNVENKSLNPKYSVIDDYSMNIFDSSNENYYFDTDVDNLVKDFVSNNSNFHIGFKYYSFNADKGYDYQDAQIQYYLFDNDLDNYEILLSQNTYDNLKEKNLISNNKFKFRNVEANINILEGNYYFDFFVTNEYTFKQIDKFNTTYINTIEETQVHLTSGRSPENDNEITLYRYQNKNINDTFEYSYGGITKEFIVVGIYDYVESSIYETMPWCIVVDTALDFALEADVFNTRYINFIAYGNTLDLSEKDMNCIIDSHLFIINDMIEESYNAYINFKNIRSDFVRMLVFVITFDILIIFFYISFWFNSNRERYLELRRLNRIKLIRKKCIKSKIILNCFIFIGGIISFAILQNVINNDLLNKCFTYSSIKIHKLTFTYNNFLIVLIPLIIVLQLIITYIQLRRSLYDRT